VANPGLLLDQLLQKSSNKSPFQNRTRMLRYFDDDVPLLCYTVRHLFYIPPVLVVWWCTTSKTGEFTSEVQKNQPIIKVHYKACVNALA
jgi:hypothetical protein